MPIFKIGWSKILDEQYYMQQREASTVLYHCTSVSVVFASTMFSNYSSVIRIVLPCSMQCYIYHSKDEDRIISSSLWLLLLNTNVCDQRQMIWHQLPDSASIIILLGAERTMQWYHREIVAAYILSTSKWWVTICCEEIAQLPNQAYSMFCVQLHDWPYHQLLETIGSSSQQDPI